MKYFLGFMAWVFTLPAALFAFGLVFLLVDGIFVSVDGLDEHTIMVLKDYYVPGVLWLGVPAAVFHLLKRKVS